MHWVFPHPVLPHREPCSSTQSSENILGAVINEAVLGGDIVFPNRLTAKFQDVIGVAGGQFCPISSHYLEGREAKRVWGFFLFFSIATQTKGNGMELNTCLWLERKGQATFWASLTLCSGETELSGKFLQEKPVVTLRSSHPKDAPRAMWCPSFPQGDWIMRNALIRKHSLHPEDYRHHSSQLKPTLWQKRKSTVGAVYELVNRSPSSQRPIWCQGFLLLLEVVN